MEGLVAPSMRTDALPIGKGGKNFLREHSAHLSGAEEAGHAILNPAPTVPLWAVTD